MKKLKKVKKGIMAVPVLIIGSVLGLFFMTFMAIFVRKKGKNKDKKKAKK
jgi:hypothetical protein